MVVNSASYIRTSGIWSTCTMSRLIVKNLPQKCSEEKLKEMFSCCGEVTDVRLIRTRTGISRKFGFIGFNSAQHAEEALKQFNKTYIGASKIEVEVAKPYGDHTLAQPWSRYSKVSSTHWEGPGSAGEEGQGSDEGVETKLGKMMKEYEDLEDSPEFQEFLRVHTHKSKVKTWSDNPTEVKGRGLTMETEGNGHVKPERSKSMSNVEQDDGDEPVMEDNPITSHAITDLDYLRTKVVQSTAGSDGDLNGQIGHPSQTQTGDGKDVLATTSYTVKMLGLPFRAGKKDVHTFFHPLKVVSIRFTQDSQGRPSGRAYADFLSEQDLNQALERDGDCIFHRYIELFRDMPTEKDLEVEKSEENSLKPWELKAALGDKSSEVESIIESGRIFIRNLPFSTQEEDLNELFGGYGPLTEVTIPLSKDTNRSTGLGFVTFMLPEHAAKAYQELDGQIFQGRLLHLLPAHAKRGQERMASHQHSSFKKKKEVKMRSEAGGDHNWNSLFLGANAVVDVMAEKYATEKSEILDPSASATSAAVRMALGETQVVRETREFLQQHGVNLDVFEQTKPTRSKTVVMVKNLPSATTEGEIFKLFERFGQLLRVIVPPAGISALVEFAEVSHAREAFSKLAYSNFKHLPLYLEWAPENVLDKSLQTSEPVKVGDFSEEEPASTTSVFVKNLNFSTKDDSLKELFLKVGGLKSVSIARKRNPKSPSSPLSMGFGFVEYETENLALDAIKRLQHAKLDGHVLELKLSRHRTKKTPATAKKTSKHTKQKSAKLLVRNVPFEASKQELCNLFSTFGTLKMVRLPKKLSAGSGKHRGFAFVEFSSKEDAKRAFEALSYSTHLYGRRLVLEWAEQEESLEAIRKRTAEHFHGFKVPAARRTKGQEQTLLDTLEK